MKNNLEIVMKIFKGKFKVLKKIKEFIGGNQKFFLEEKL